MHFAKIARCVCCQGEASPDRTNLVRQMTIRCFTQDCGAAADSKSRCAESSRIAQLLSAGSGCETSSLYYTVHAYSRPPVATCYCAGSFLLMPTRRAEQIRTRSARFSGNVAASRDRLLRPIRDAPEKLFSAPWVLHQFPRPRRGLDVFKF